MKFRYLLLGVALAALAPLSRGEDQSDRDRKARAALALSGSAKSPATAAAPAPRAKAPKDYPQGYKAATATQQPLVVFVGCEIQPVADAISCKCDAPSFGEVQAPAVVVAYPVGDRLMIDATLPGCPTPAAVQKAVTSAAKKLDAPPARQMPAPKPLDWSISSDTVSPLAEQVAKPSASTVFVHMDVGGGRGQAGTGTVIACENGESLILTCAHVIPAGDRPLKVIHDKKTYPATFIAAGANTGNGYEPDLCLLWVAAELPAVPLADESPKVGARLRQWGFGGRQYGAPPSAKTGEVLPAERPNGWRAVGGDLLSTMAVESGDSGSGVFNDAGELCAVTWAGGPGAVDPDMNHAAVPVVKVRAFVKAHAVRFPRLHAKIHGRSSWLPPEPATKPAAGAKAAKPGCKCGPECECCPAEKTKPAAPKAAAPAPTMPPRLIINGAPYELRSDGRYWPMDGCPGGKCRIK